MKNVIKRKVLATILAVMLVFQTSATVVFAADILPGGVCTQNENGNILHSEDYSYASAIEEMPADCETCNSKEDVTGEQSKTTGEALSVTGGTENTDYSYENHVLTILSGTALTISGSGTATSDKIVVRSGITADITLSDVHIGVSSYLDCAFDIAGATVNLTLTGTNTLESGQDAAGLHVPEGAALTVTEGSSGSLTADGGYSAAGIGGNNQGSCGTVTINGGRITANGSDYGAGIGGGSDGAGGSVTINSGNVIASGGRKGTGIGGGIGGNAGTFFANGSGNAFIVASSIADKTNQGNWKGVIFDANEGRAYGNPTITADEEIPANMTLSVESGMTLTVADGVTLNNNGILKISGTLTGDGTVQNNVAAIKSKSGIISISHWKGDAVIERESVGVFFLTKDDGGELIPDRDYTYEAGVLTIKTAEPITIEMPKGMETPVNRIVVPSGSVANITLNNVKLDMSDSDSTCAFDMTGATVNLTLAGENTLKSGNECAGLQVPDGAALIITEESTGSLTASGDEGAGIGGGNGSVGGSITINGGSVKASGGDASAGIGGGQDRAGGTITINGGTVLAKGGADAAGIGGGSNRAGGIITINGGSITAIAGNASAGIGGGNGGSGGIITISGGKVEAKGGEFSGAGIGGSVGAEGGTISISGGTVLAKGGGNTEFVGGAFGAAGIGGGPGCKGVSIIISGGTVIARGGGNTTGTSGAYGGAGIGSGAGPNSDVSIIISGGTVDAVGGEGDKNGAGIGVGAGGTDGGNGSFSTVLEGDAGNAFIVSSSISDQSNAGSWNGVIFQKDRGEVYGSPIALTTDAEIPAGKLLTVNSGQTLIIDSGVTLTNSGILENSGVIVNKGDIVNKGTISGSGTINNASSVAVAFSESNVNYGDEVTITATVQKKTKSRAANGSADFYLGNVNSGIKLGTSNVTASGDTVTATLTMTKAVWETSGARWAIGKNTITADFSGSTGLLASTGTGTFTIARASITPAVTISDWTYNTTANSPQISGNTGSGAVTVYYKSQGAEDSTYMDSVPTNAGRYTVKVEIAQTTYYNSGNGTADFTIKKASQTAPEVTSAAENILGKNDGKIDGLTTAMEYSTGETGAYTKVTDSNMTFAPGTYYVRYSANENYNASAATDVTIAAGGTNGGTSNNNTSGHVSPAISNHVSPATADSGNIMPLLILLLASGGTVAATALKNIHLRCIIKSHFRDII